MFEVFKELFQYWPTVELVAYVMLFYVPQWVRLVCRKSSDDISIVSWVASAFGNAGYALWGVWYGTPNYVFACVIGLICQIITLVMIVVYRHGDGVERECVE